jgi:hypothetical protein
MVRRTRRWMVSAFAASAASVTLAGRIDANTGQDVPRWGVTTGTTDLQAGPLGLNPAPDPGQVPVAMRIPDAGVDAEVEQQQIVDGQMLDPSGPWVVAWYDNTARAGELGNCIGSGHVDYWGVGPSVFHEVSSLSEGALIDVIGRDGATYTYALEYIRRIDVYDTTVEELNSPEMVGATDYAALTLITCGGNFNGQEYTQRDIIRARLQSVTSADGGTADVAATDEETEAGAEDAGEIAEGGSVTVTDDGVNLRAEPSVSADVVTVLSQGTTLSITGGSEEGDGFTWWPVELEDGTTGWVVEDFLEAAS